MDILEAVAEGFKKPTHIMRYANLSPDSNKKYLCFTLNQGLLEKEGNGRKTTYSLNQEGKNALEYFKKLEIYLYSKVQS
jgi:predicted transcriptional regulator